MAFIPTTTFISTPARSTPVCKSPSTHHSLRTTRRSILMTSTVEKGSGMRIIEQADEATIQKLGCRTWSKWGCEPSTFPWTYADDEVCLVLEGDFTVIPDDGGEKMDVKKGDIAYFPKGMSCTWEVRKTVDKHFAFGIKI